MFGHMSPVIILLLLAGHCSEVESSNDIRVVNGTTTSIELFPYMVQIRRNDRFWCGGTALTAFWVLTAAHCTQDKLKVYSIRHSASDVGDGLIDENVISAQHIWNHENYNVSNQYLHDISLIRVERPMHIDRFVRLPRRPFEDYEHGSPATLIGWGLNETGGSIQQQLQRVDLMVFSDEECARRHSTATPPHPSNVCGGVPEGGRGHCLGDSGGPLLLNGIAVGIVSWSVKPCTIYPYPGVYTQLSYYLDWIQHRVPI